MDSALLNRMLDQRVKDLAARNAAGTAESRRIALQVCLGMAPWAPRPGVATVVDGVISRQGYRVERLRYESSPGCPVTAHLYIGDGEGARPLILRPHDAWPFGLQAPVVQAGAISLALGGFACLVVAAPGRCEGETSTFTGKPRGEMGRHWDPFLNMGMPVQGRYVADVLRGIEALAGRDDIDLTRVGITGEGSAADTAMYAYALDDRILAAVLVAGFESRELFPVAGCPCRSVPGVAALGDRSDVLAVRAPEGAVMLLGAESDSTYPLSGNERTQEKLRRVYRSRSAEGRLRSETFFGGHDYNRRMREAALAFFGEHLCGRPSAPMCPEARPLTDGFLNPYPSETVDPEDPEFGDGETVNGPTLRDLLANALDHPFPSPFLPEARLVTWRKYGTISPIRPGAIFAIHDVTVPQPTEPGSMPLNELEIDMARCALLGLSVAEFLAQILHVFLPGGPDTWEMGSTGMGHDPLTSMIASMKTLVAPREAPPKLLVAAGPVASMVARFVGRYRPDLQIQASHVWTGWRQALDQEIGPNAQPLARYLEWV